MFNESTYRYDDGNLGFNWFGLIGTGGSIGGGIAAKLIGGAAGGPIGAGIALVSSLISGIFAQHQAKVQREDQISGAWAAAGPQAISTVMSSYHAGQISASEASQSLDSIEAQFYQMTAPITKFNGQFGAFPDANGPRPSNNCNWACGTSWDLHQQLLGYKAQLTSGGSSGVAGLNLGSLTSDPVTLIGLGVLAYLLMK